jgi:hypothetical protein
MTILGRRSGGDAAYAAAKQAIDALTADFFRLFEKSGDHPIDLTRIHALFIPQGMIIKNTGPEPEIYDLAGFIAPRQALLEGPDLSAFAEEELAERTDIFGNIAQRFSLYRKSGIRLGVAFEALGMKTLQFVLTPAGWRISSLAWDDCSEGLDIPADYLPPT